MARNNARVARGPRNTAPGWKKGSVVLSAPVAVFVVVSLLNASTWPFLFLLPLVVAVAAGAVWLTARLLKVRLSLRSWD
jgi:hypothetical protein